MRMMTLDVLPAGRGDCLWVECARPGLAPWRMLIDGGLPNCYSMLRERLKTLAKTGPVFFDLVVVSHIDSDHIGGLLPLFAETDIDVRFGDIWFNGLEHLPERADARTAPAPQNARIFDFVRELAPTVVRSVAEGARLVDLLKKGTDGRVLPWNEQFGRAAVMTKGDGAFETITFPDGPTLTLLSPTPKRLAALRTKWENETGKLGRGDPSDDDGPALPLPLDDLRGLAAQETELDKSAANGSSIAFLLEYAGRRCLFGADAFSSVLGKALTNLANSRDGKAIELDAFKLPHHGSEKNVTSDLLAVTPAERYIVSTNGDRFGHPNDVALARIVTCEVPPATLCFNYRNDAIERWNEPELKQKNGFSAEVPATMENPGVHIELPERP